MAIERYYKTAELAELLGFCTETILRYAQRGELQSIRIGNDRRYAESAVRDFLERHADRTMLAAVPGVGDNLGMLTPRRLRS
jgi:excisionase family DNA binding protein